MAHLRRAIFQSGPQVRQQYRLVGIRKIPYAQGGGLHEGGIGLSPGIEVQIGFQRLAKAFALRGTQAFTYFVFQGARQAREKSSCDFIVYTIEA